jgi:uncharacterized protein YllA (UPF0747 family)
MNADLAGQIDQRILDMQLEAAQCLVAAAKRSTMKPAVLDRIEQAVRRFHGLAAFTEPDAVDAFASMTLLDATSPAFRTLAEPFMQRIRGTPYLIPSAIAQEFFASLPEDCWGH